MQYGPIYIMVEATVLIMLEKLTMLFPRLSQKLERFYKSVVEEALLGKDPDVAEDFTGTAISTEKVLRERQREEICGALRNSSIFYRLYVGKNLMTVSVGAIAEMDLIQKHPIPGRVRPDLHCVELRFS